jgi:hypothetical protein
MWSEFEFLLFEVIEKKNMHLCRDGFMSSGHGGMSFNTSL